MPVGLKLILFSQPARRVFRLSDPRGSLILANSANGGELASSEGARYSRAHAKRRTATAITVDPWGARARTPRVAHRHQENRLRYLVTGGAGFIGSHIVDELVKRGQQVIVLDDLSSGKEQNFAAVRASIEFRAETITKLDAVQAASKHCDCVIHLAARTSVPRSVEDPLETNAINIDGTLNVLLAARDCGVRRFVYAASSSAYGEAPSLPKSEIMPASPISPYGVTKYVGELYARVFGHVYGLENVSLRFFNVFGPRQDPSSQYSGVLSRFMLALVEGKPPVVYGDGEQSRDFTYVANIVDAVLRACQAQGVSGMVFNGGTGARITLNAVLRQLQVITGKKVCAKHEPQRTGDIRHSQADVSLALKMLGYRPLVDFAEGLRRTWEWYQGTYA